MYVFSIARHTILSRLNKQFYSLLYLIQDDESVTEERDIFLIPIIETTLIC